MIGLWIRKVILRRVIGYRNERRYWEWRYAHGHIERNPNYRSEMEEKVRKVMVDRGCKNVLEIGCGQVALKGLPNHTGLDFSRNIDCDIHADITKRIPLPDKCFDAVLSSKILMHIPSEKIERACTEISRVGKLVILNEPRVKTPEFNCYDHDYKRLFKDTPMVVVTEERLP